MGNHRLKPISDATVGENVGEKLRVYDTLCDWDKESRDVPNVPNHVPNVPNRAPTRR